MSGNRITASDPHAAIARGHSGQAAAADIRCRRRNSHRRGTELSRHPGRGALSRRCGAFDQQHHAVRRCADGPSCHIHEICGFRSDMGAGRHSRAAHSAWASRNLAAMHSPSRASFFASAAAQPAISSATRFSTSEASPPNCLKSAGRMRSTYGTHTLSRAAAITDSRRGLHSARALRIAARWSHGPLLPTHFVIDCWQRPRTHARSFVWTCLLVLSSETTAAAAALVPASIVSSCCVTQPSSAAAACSPVTQGLVRVAKSSEKA